MAFFPFFNFSLLFFCSFYNAWQSEMKIVQKKHHNTQKQAKTCSTEQIDLSSKEMSGYEMKEMTKLENVPHHPGTVVILVKYRAKCIKIYFHLQSAQAIIYFLVFTLSLLLLLKNLISSFFFWQHLERPKIDKANRN